MNNKSTERFCNNYGASVRPAPPRWKMVADHDVFFDCIQEDKDIFKYNIPEYRKVEEEMVDITMSKESFAHLVGRIDYIEEVLGSGSAVSNHPADRVWDQYLQEERARRNNPGIQKAYEKYALFLQLAGVKRLG